MDNSERQRLRKAYSLMPEEELLQMLSVDRGEYTREAYELLLEEARRRGIEGQPEKKAQPDVTKESHEDEEYTIGSFITLMRVNTEADRAFLQSILETTDIPYYFKSIHRIIGVGDAPAYLMVQKSREQEVATLLKDFIEGT